jgi:hypothetical protein
LTPLVVAAFYEDAPRDILPGALVGFPVGDRRASILEERLSAEIVSSARKYSQRLWGAPRGIGLMRDRDGSWLEKASVANYWSVEAAYPALFFNVTSVNSGRRLYIGPFHLEDLGASGDTLAAQERLAVSSAFLSSDLSIIKAAVMSARYPLITPPASIRWENSKGQQVVVRLADGGYYENSGISTALDIIKSLEKSTRAVADDLAQANLTLRIRLIVTTGYQQTTEDSKAFIELGSPLRAMLKARVARGQDFAEAARFLVASGDAPPRLDGSDSGSNGVLPRPRLSIAEFSVSDARFKPVLGWALSKDALLGIRRRIAQEMRDKNRKNLMNGRTPCFLSSIGRTLYFLRLAKDGRGTPARTVFSSEAAFQSTGAGRGRAAESSR